MMGELAATLDAFDQEFEKALHPLRADDSVRILPRATLELALAESNLPLTTSCGLPHLSTALGRSVAAAAKVKQAHRLDVRTCTEPCGCGEALRGCRAITGEGSTRARSAQMLLPSRACRLARAGRRALGEGSGGQGARPVPRS